MSNKFMRLFSVLYRGRVVKIELILDHVPFSLLNPFPIKPMFETKICLKAHIFTEVTYVTC